MRIVALAPERSANAAYRAVLPMQALAERGHDTEYLFWDESGPPPLERLRGADVVHAWRLFRGPTRRLAGALREAGTGFVFDNDDDMTRVPKGSPAYAEMKGARQQVARELTATMRLAQLTTTTCGELANRLRRLGGDVRVVENYVGPDFVRAREPSGGEVVVGWVAGGEHRGDLRDLRLRRTFETLLERHPHVRLVSVGLDLGVRSDRYAHRPPMNFWDLPDVIARFDLALAPIADVSFNRVRSNVKVKEYAAAGVPWLASPIGPYRDLGEEQGGRLVPDHGWDEALDELVADGAARAALAERASAWGRTQTVARNAAGWEAVFAEAAQRAGRTVSVSPAGRDAPEAPAADGGAGGARPRTVVPRPIAPATTAEEPASRPRRGLFRRRASG
ncbi:MAG: hypothetical protein JSS99_17045 [Actinobacteria bacterium]|nr:hypothetical protein [Actinomycetota bacterium]